MPTVINSLTGVDKVQKNVMVASGGGTDYVFHLNDVTIANSYTIPTNKNALTAGPITILDNVVITVPDGSAWTIV